MRAAFLSLCLLLAGCATSVFNPATNVPITRATPPGMDAPEDIVGENAVALSFSGGGLRAAAIAHGVLTALRDTKTAGGGSLADEIVFISSVSGGSLAAAHFGLYGVEGMDRFRENVLLRDFEADMRLSITNPDNLLRIFGGGLNARENFGESLDKHVFNGATFADLYKRRKSDIRIHATDVYNRLSFPFIPRIFSVLCSDIRPYSIADAVVASMAVPLVFAPVVVRTYPDHCTAPLPRAIAQARNDPDAPPILKSIEKAMSSYRDPSKVRYVKLIDGGVTDNLGLATLAVSRAISGTAYAPMTERDAVKVRRMLFLVVDAARGPHGAWALEEPGPPGVELALHVTDVATESMARYAADGFWRMLKEWEASLIEFRCGLTLEQVARLGGPVKDWHCSDVRFYFASLSIDNLSPEDRAKLEVIPTRLTLPPEQIDAAIDAARRTMLSLPRFRQFLFERMKPSP
ncbi:patatin-like phospholipase family protein [Usitatibacter palustris]|uniref:PNPLA domain-containing protein n=1 Tax=Usitatibacter palustris TaxID=2732487 RepID=A0A6M4HAT4_9PROT|nr:patatin-like phospholipase family protein [Usitatibacter palustris]QJR16671.1 hypothetical protein DSM104440_03507 [Usitatibacter palustris]